MKKRIFAMILAALMILPMLAAFSAQAAGEDGITVGFSSPAICTDVGKAVDLAKVALQFAPNEAPVAASAITWKEGERTVTSYTPTAKGVYALSASADGKTRTVYVVAKDASETEYVLYENDFSTAPDFSEFRVVSQPTGTTYGYDEAEGAIYLDASNGSSNMLRILLPEFLDDFGDAVYSADIKISKQVNSSRWCSLVIRQQNPSTTKLPYLQVVSRYDNSASNGLEIAERTSSDSWSVSQKGACSGVTPGTYFTISAAFCGGKVTNSINGKTYLTETHAPYTSGAMGLQANGSRMTVSRVRITVNPESGVVDNTAGLHDTRDVSSNIALAPALVTEVTTAEQLAALNTTLPAVAVFNAKMNGSELGIELDGKFSALADTQINDKVIPAIRVSTKAEAEALGKYAKTLKVCDMYVIASDMSFIKAARKLCANLYAMAQVEKLPEDTEKLRRELIECGARGIIVTDSLASRAEVSYLQDRYLVVWQKTDGRDISIVAAINNGVLGIVTPDVAATEACFTKYYTKNTLVRTPEIIGHRGIPSKAQENSLAGALLAIKEGATMVECDVYLMKDGKVVVMHDSTLDRTTTGTGNITDQTATTLDKFKIDYPSATDLQPIPLLDDLLAAFKESGEVLVIELKSSNQSLCKSVVDLIAKHEMQKQVVVIAFSKDMIAAIRRADPGISVNYLSSAIKANEEGSLTVAAQILGNVIPINTCYSPSHTAGTLGPNLYADLAARGVTVWNWTVNKQDAFNAFFISGIRGITTNYADWSGKYVEDFDILRTEDGKIELKAMTYSGSNVGTSKAELVVIGGTGEYKDGVVTLSEGAEGFFFRLKRNLTDGTVYSVVTPVMLALELNVPEDTEQTESDATLTTSSPDTTEVAGGGCTGAISVPVVAVIALAALAIKVKKNERI